MKNTSLPLILTLFLGFIIFFNLSGQSKYKKNDHVKISLKKANGNYLIDYTFKDQFSQTINMKIVFPIEGTEAMIDRFGIPNWLFKRYQDTPANRYKRKQIIEEGLFVQNGNYLEINYNAVVEYYSPFCKPIAQSIINLLTQQQKDSRLNRIEMAMRFVQDIPYGVPPSKNGKRYFGGILTPPQVLIKKYGDCDSKALLFAGILSFLIDSSDIIFLHQNDHLLTAIKGIPSAGDTYIEYNASTYLLAETAGPANRSLGEKGQYYNKKFSVQPLNITKQ